MTGPTRPKLLVGPFLRARWSSYMENAFADFKTLTFGAWEGSDVRTGANPDLPEILRSLPDGWTPDLFLLWRPEYGTIPTGLEDAPFPTAALVSDWYLAFADCLEAARRVDVLVTGTRGERVYRAAGCANVMAMPMLGYEPGLDGGYGLPHDRRDIDVYCGGNPNWVVHRERAGVHAELRKLPETVRLLEGEFVDRQEFNRRMGRARIFVNQTVIGEINMKVYEATASGTCLFVEEDNLDIRDYLQDHRSVVLFRRDNVNEKILHYLENENERARIADAGRDAMSPFTYRANARAIVERLLAESPRAGIRPVSLLPENERAESLAGYGLRHNGDDWVAPLRLCRNLGDEPRPLLIQACAHYAARVLAPEEDVWEDSRILKAFSDVARADPAYLPGVYSWARIAAAHLDPQVGAQALDLTEALVRSGCAIPTGMADPYLAMEQTRRFVFERTAWEALEKGESTDEALRPVLLEDLGTVRRELARRS